MNESEFESDPKVIDKYIRLHRTGDPNKMQQASEFFYKQLNRYVMKLAHEYYPTFMASRGEELIQCAWIGILEGVDRYDPYSYAMTTHFKPYILKQMSLLIQDAPSGHLADNLSKLRKAQDTDSPPDAAELSRKSGLSRTRVENGLSRFYLQNTVDLDEIGGILVDECPDNQPDQALLQKEQINLLKEELCRRLNRPEYEYICDRFGLFGSNTARVPSANFRERPVIFAKLRDSTVLQRLAQGLG